MSGYNETNSKTFTTAEAVVAARLVTYNTTADQCAYTAAGSSPIGVTWRDAASGDPVAVRLINAGGTFEMTAATATITVGELVYPAASGKISDTPVGQPIGVALEASAADGDIIEVLAIDPLVDRKQFTIKTADYTITKQESGAVFSNLGASGAVKFTLPQDAPSGTYFHFGVQTAQSLQVDAGAAGGLYAGGAKSADDAMITADDEGESIMVVADGAGDWIVMHTVGTWTVS